MTLGPVPDHKPRNPCTMGIPANVEKRGFRHLDLGHAPVGMHACPAWQRASKNQPGNACCRGCKTTARTGGDGCSISWGAAAFSLSFSPLPLAYPPSGPAHSN